MKIVVIGCGLRTPLLIHGLTHSELPVSRIALYDVDPRAAQLMAALGTAIAAGKNVDISAEPDLSEAIHEASFVISSIRVGGMQARARDERVALECGFAGQETTGPAGFAMALRTVPVAIEHARLVERLAPDAWIINFTNPAGLITQAISVHTGTRVVGICDTPAELFFRISLALGEPLEHVDCDYLGLNHLGWVRKILVRGEDVTDRILSDDEALGSLYAVELFPPELIRELRLIPTEYLFFYYRPQTAIENQLRAGVTRGEELLQLNQRLLTELESNVQKGDSGAALEAYKAYLNRRNASYMKLEGEGQSAFASPDVDWDPFQGVTGYHRIAVDSIRALSSRESSKLVLNIANRGAIDDLADEDIVEVPCLVNQSGAQPLPVGQLPESGRALTVAVKTYERLTIQAALQMKRSAAVLALSTNPIVGDWDRAERFVDKLRL